MNRKKPRQETPLRHALSDHSSLRQAVADGLGAVEAEHRRLFHVKSREALSDSLDLDKAMEQRYKQENRWDYLIGHEPSRSIVAVEPHSARQGEVAAVIRKRRAALVHLHDHLRRGIRVRRRLWVAAGKVHFADTEKTKLQLAQHGIEFVGTKIGLKHLASGTQVVSRRRRRD